MQKKESLGSSFSLERTAADFYPATTACELFTTSELSTVHPRQQCHLSFCEYWLSIRSENPKTLILTRGVLYSPSSIPSRVHPSVQPCQDFVCHNFVPDNEQKAPNLRAAGRNTKSWEILKFGEIWISGTFEDAWAGRESKHDQRFVGIPQPGLLSRGRSPHISNSKMRTFRNHVWCNQYLGKLKHFITLLYRCYKKQLPQGQSILHISFM